MNFENKLISGVFIKRYKRFFVDVKIKKETVVAHCPNTGSMLGLLKEGNKVWHELCRDCDSQIQECKSKIKGTDKQEYKIDNKHTYMIGKYGPVIKQTLEDDKVVFKSVKKDLNIEKLKNGEYKLEEIVEENDIED